MAVGTTAMIVGGLIAAGSKVASSAIAAHGATEAAKTQSAAADKAAGVQQAATADSQRFLREQLAQQQAIMRPFVASGQAAYTTLGDALGIKPATLPGTPQTGQLGAGPSAADPNLPQLGGGATGWSAPVAQPGGGQSQQWMGPGPNPLFQPGTPGYAAQQPGGAPQGAPVPPPQAQTDSGYARITWPDSSTDTVPSEHVAQYLMLGAKQV